MNFDELHMGFRDTDMSYKGFQIDKSPHGRWCAYEPRGGAPKYTSHLETKL